MPEASNTIMIRRPVDQVFAFVARGENNKSWRSAVLDIAKISGTYDAVGAEYRQTLRGPFGRSISGDYRITVFEPGKLIAFAVTSGPARPTGRYDFRQVGSDTEVTFSLSLRPTGLQRLISPMIQSTMNKEVANLVRLREVVEGRSPGTGG